MTRLQLLEEIASLTEQLVNLRSDAERRALMRSLQYKILELRYKEIAAVDSSVAALQGERRLT
jgi:hypothetical protein